jgi:hypothetical protein
MEALALGWPKHPSIESILDHSGNSASPEVLLASIGVRIARGIHEDSDFDVLLEMSRRRREIDVDYGWRDEIANELAKGWRGSQSLKAKCLEALGGRYDHRGDLLSNEIATRVLLSAFPHDADVAKYCAYVIANDRYPFIGMFDRSDAWRLLRENFEDDSVIVAAIDPWLEKDKVDSMNVSLAGQVGRTPRAKQMLIETLAVSFPHWSAWCVWRIADSGEISNSPHTGARMC